MEATYEEEKRGDERLVAEDEAMQRVKDGSHWGRERLLLKGRQQRMVGNGRCS
jgi:hypothetical protein